MHSFVPLLSSLVAAGKAVLLPVGSLSDVDQAEFSRFFSDMAWGLLENGDKMRVSQFVAV